MSGPRFKDALAILCRHHVDFIIVGGVAAVLNGAPISTFDLDIVHARDDANVGRLLTALVELDAKYRDLSGRILLPDHAGLMGTGHHLLITTCGPLDVLGQIGGTASYEDLLGETIEQAIDNYPIRVLNLTALIRTKEAAGRDKDRAVLAILRRTLAESST